MRFSKYFSPTLRETPADVSIASHKLMLRAGLISQTAAGIYCWLPLGVKVLEKIQKIIDKEQSKIDASKICMTTIQPAELWIESGRYNDYGSEMLRVKDRKDGNFLYSPTNEEQVTDLFRKYVKSYKQLPVNLYQIQWKFRDEIRPRFGVMRGREFLMKDGYSFNLTREAALETYKDEFNAYLEIFRNIGLTPIPVQAVSGAIGGNVSHEFHILADTGESTLYYDKSILNLRTYEEFTNSYAVSDEKYDADTCPIQKSKLGISKGIEVGHIFYFGKKYSQSMNAFVTNENGEKIYPEMGSYGIGVSRLVGAIIEASHDEKGIIWPKQVSPFDVHLINLHSNAKECIDASESLYSKLLNAGVDVLYDDRKLTPGEKLNDADLIGMPYQIIVGKKKIGSDLVELKNRKDGSVSDVSLESVISKFI